MASPATAVRCGGAAELCPAPDAGQSKPAEAAPCLHCGASRDAAGSACPRCGHPQPRRYDPGLCHLDLVSVEDPAQLQVPLLRLWPRLGCAQLRSFDGAARSLSWGPRRLLSFVARDEATALQEELARSGVRCRRVEEPRWPWALIALFSLSLVGFTSLSYGPGPYLFAYALYFFSEPLVSLGRARQSLLGASRLPRSLWPALQLRAGVLTLILASVEGSLVARGIDALSFTGAFHLLVALLAGLAAVASLTMLGSGPGPLSPEPAWSEQLRCLAHARNAWLRSDRPPMPRRRRRPPSKRLQLLSAVAFSAVLLAETALLQGQNSARPAAAPWSLLDGTGAVSSTLANTPDPPTPIHPARKKLQRGLAQALPLIALLLLIGLARRSFTPRRNSGTHSLLIHAVDDPLLASGWLVERFGRRVTGSPTRLLGRLERQPGVLLTGISASWASELIQEAAPQGLKLRAVWGRSAPGRHRIDELGAGAVVAGAFGHLLLVGVLGWVGLVMGARLEQLLLLPVGVGLVLLPLLRRRSRRPLLSLRRPGARARRSAGRGSSSPPPRVAL